MDIVWGIIAIFLLLLFLLYFAAVYLFHYIVCRKQWELPGFLTNMICGNEPEGGEIDPYYKDVDQYIKKLKEQQMERLTITTPDGLVLKANFWRAENPSNCVVIAVHGCRSSGLGEFCFAAEDYHVRGFNLLLPDLRACGESDGKYMGYGCLESEDMMLWVKQITERFGDECRLWLHGVSMGGATVLMMSNKNLPRQVKGIISDCSYTSAWEEFAYQLKNSFHLPVFPLLPLVSSVCKYIAGYFFGNASPIRCVREAKVPILFVHGEKDDYVPTNMGCQLYDACKAEKDLFLVEDAVHARSYRTDTAGYQEKLFGFIQKGIEKGEKEE